MVLRKRLAAVQRWACATGLTVALAVVPAPQAATGAAWVPNESLVSSQQDLLDPEYSQARARITWVDSTGKLWVAAIDRETGLFSPVDGKGVLVDADAMSINDLTVIGNGPEWLSTSGLDQIVYTKFVAGRPHTRANARLALAAQSANGSWSYRFLGNRPRNAPYASDEPNDPTPRISYVDPAGNHYWREVAKPATETLVPWYPPSYYSMRFVRGARAVVFLAPIDGHLQVFRYGLDNQVLEQLTFDEGLDDTTNVPWMWQAPEFGGEFLLAVLARNDWELRIYRQVDPTNPAWSVIYRARQPGGGALGSPEPFVHNGKSYVFMHATVPPNNFPSRIFLSNIDGTNPQLLQLTPDLPLRVRRDPEVFVTNSGPFIYYSRLGAGDPLSAAVPQAVCLTCSSEGVFRTHTGLGPSQP